MIFINVCRQLEPVPPTTEFIKTFDALDSNGPLPISWKWPHGRRAPTDSSGFIEEDVEEEEETKYVGDHFSVLFIFLQTFLSITYFNYLIVLSELKRSQILTLWMRLPPLC